VPPRQPASPAEGGCRRGVGERERRGRGCRRGCPLPCRGRGRRGRGGALVPSPLPRVGAAQLRARARRRGRRLAARMGWSGAQGVASRERERVSRAAAVAASSRVERAQLRERGCRGGAEGAFTVALLWRFCGASVCRRGQQQEGSKRAARGQRIESGARGRWGLSGGRREDGRGGAIEAEGEFLWCLFGALLALILLLKNSVNDRMN
jgi:hypothetical protein